MISLLSKTFPTISLSEILYPSLVVIVFTRKGIYAKFIDISEAEKLSSSEFCK